MVTGLVMLSVALITIHFDDEDVLATRFSRLSATSPYLKSRARVQCALSIEAEPGVFKNAFTTSVTERPG